MDFVSLPPSLPSTLYTNAFLYLLLFPSDGFLEGQLLSQMSHVFMVLDLVAWLVQNIFYSFFYVRYQTVNNPDAPTAWVLDVVLSLL